MFRACLALLAVLWTATAPAMAQTTGIPGPVSTSTMNLRLTVDGDDSFALIFGLTELTFPTAAPGESSLTSTVICIYHSSPTVRFEAFTADAGAPDPGVPLTIVGADGTRLSFLLTLGYQDTFGRATLSTNSGFATSGVAFLNSTPDCSGAPNVDFAVSLDVPPDTPSGLYLGTLVLRVGVE